MPNRKYYDGSAFQTQNTFQYYDGSAFASGTGKYWDGAQWVTIGTTIPNSGGTHQYNQDEGSGTTTADYIGSLDATLNNVSWTSGAGIGNYHLSYDGSSSYADLGTASQSEFTHFTNAQTGTFAAWVNANDNASVQLLFGGIIGAGVVSVKLYINGDGTLKWRGDDGSGTAMWTTTSTSVIPTNEWRLVAGTVDGSTARLYLEDSTGSMVEEASAAVSGGTTADWTNPAVLGKSPDNIRYFNGGMGVPYFDSTADTQSELQTWRDNTVEYFSDTTTTTSINFASDGTGQALYPIQPPAYYSATDNTTFIIWQGESLDPHVTSYDHDTDAWADSNTRVGSNPLVGDMHGVPSIAATSDGTLHAFWGAHQDPMKYAQSDNAWDTSSWTAQSDIGSETTYPKPMVNDTNDDIYLFLRKRADDYSTSDNTPETIYKSTDTGSSWSEIGPVIDFDTDSRIYVFNTAQNGTVIHLTWLWYDKVDGERYNIYHAQYDMADDTMQAQDGAALTTPVNKSTADNNCLVYETKSVSEPVNHNRVALDNNNNPHIVFNHNNGGTWEYRYTYWNGTAWTAPTTITTSGHQFSSGTIDVSTTSDITAYLARSSDSDKGGDIEEWQYDGSSWTLQQTVLSKSESGEDLNHPRTVNPTQASPLKLVFQQSNPADTSTSDLKVYAYGSNGFVER